MGRRVAVILSGCGFQDGAEIHESVCALLALDRAGASVQCFAPNVDQAQVTNHCTGDVGGPSRNVLVESARIARGQIKDCKTLDAAQFDALIMPGGYGAALNLCTFGTNGATCTVQPDVERAVRAFHAARKPIGAICIAPALVARVLGSQGVRLTIGTDAATAAQITKTGAQHEPRAVTQICVDDAHKIVSTPAYMLATRIGEAEAGISALVKQVLAMTLDN